MSTNGWQCNATGFTYSLFSIRKISTSSFLPRGSDSPASTNTGGLRWLLQGAAPCETYISNLARFRWPAFALQGVSRSPSVQRQWGKNPLTEIYHQGTGRLYIPSKHARNTTLFAYVLVELNAFQRLIDVTNFCNFFVREGLLQPIPLQTEIYKHRLCGLLKQA